MYAYEDVIYQGSLHADKRPLLDKRASAEAVVHHDDKCTASLQSVIPGEQAPGGWSILEMATQKLRCIPGPNGKGAYTTSDDVMAGIDLASKTFLVTGANSGLGLETLTQLVRAGARVLATARSKSKLEEVVNADNELKQASAIGLIVPVALELSSPSSCRSAVDTIKQLKHQLDGIILNAGVMSLPNKIVKHGMEMTFLTNYMSSYLLLTGLGSSALTPTGRVVLVSSCAMFDADGIYCDDLAFERRRWTSWGAYAQSKLACELLMQEFAKTLSPGQTCNSCHPGVIGQTNLARHYPAWFRCLLPIMDANGYGILKSTKTGTATQLYLATSPDAANVSGAYWSHCNLASTHKLCSDEALASALMQKSAEIANRLK